MLDERVQNLETNIDEMLKILEGDSEEARKGWQILAESFAASKISAEDLQRKCKRFVPFVRRFIKLPLVRWFFGSVIGLADKYSWMKKLNP